MITVVVASYRYGHLAAHCLESLRSQTQRPDKVLFVDDGAGDCAHLPSLYPEVEFVIREKNLGTVANFQDMLMRVETDRCMFLGADNWLRSDALKTLDRIKADIVTYDIMVTGERKDEILARHPYEVERYQGDFYWDRSAGHHGSMLYDTRKAQAQGYSSPPGRTLEDLVLYQRMLAAGATREHVPEAFLMYRRHCQNFNNT